MTPGSAQWLAYCAHTRDSTPLPRAGSWSAMARTQAAQAASTAEASAQSPGIQGGSSALSLVSCWIQVAALWRSLALSGNSQGANSASIVAQSVSRCSGRSAPWSSLVWPSTILRPSTLK